MARREQLIRETALLEQMGNSLLSSMKPSLCSKPLAVSPTTVQNINAEEKSDPGTGCSDMSSATKPATAT
eukprot:scaffold25009_cov122-Cylindrotheca_fusiformis.AAC.1